MLFERVHLPQNEMRISLFLTYLHWNCLRTLHTGSLWTFVCAIETPSEKC